MADRAEFHRVRAGWFRQSSLDVVEPSSRRWFVTADAVTDSSIRLAELRPQYDRMASLIAADRDEWVITHGEPKANNILITSNGPVMIDWDTFG